MVFSSIVFLYIFLPVFFLLYHISSEKLKNYLLLGASIFFYAWGAPKFVFLVLASLTVNFYLVALIDRKEKLREVYLVASVLINVGLLGYFKYANFFVENVNSVLSVLGIGAVSWTKVLLPIGISFFTFQSLTYTVDVYRKVHSPLNKLSDYLLYILMFPQLIAGPIIRFNTIADEIVDRKKNETTEYKLQGVYRFVIGLSKKVLIANTLGEQVDAIYALNIGQVDSLLAWGAILAYTFQIYFDFSGYSDMAIGLGKIMGFNFPENFNSPYVSRSITEFWRRWHITLGSWMRDYLYIPLGGNRVRTKSRLYINLITVFLLSGLWHGASWNFVIWGAWHGVFLILDRLFLEKLLKKLGAIIAVPLTFFFTVVGWLFFRIEQMDNVFAYLRKMFSFSSAGFPPQFDSMFVVTFIFAAVFSFFTLNRWGRRLEEHIFYSKHSASVHVAMSVVSLVLLIVCTAYITASGFNPFIYFRF